MIYKQNWRRLEVGVRVDATKFLKKMKKLEEVPQLSMKNTFPYYKQKTPVKSGNARNKTKVNLNQLKIRSNYAYAGRLDEGWSKQAPNGFTDPAIEYLEDFIETQVGKL